MNRAPGVPEGWDALAFGLIRLGQHEDAEQVARKAIEIFPDGRFVHHNLGPQWGIPMLGGVGLGFWLSRFIE